MTKLSTNLLSSSVSPSSNVDTNSHNQREAFSEFDSLQSKNGNKVSSNIKNLVTLIASMPANNFTIASNDMKKLLGNKKCICFFCSLKNVSNADKLTFMKNIFIPGKSLGLLKKIDEKSEKSFFIWFCCSSIEDEAYCMHCILFNGGLSERKIQLVHTPDME